MYSLRISARRLCVIKSHAPMQLPSRSRLFTHSSTALLKQMPPRPKLPETDIHEVFLKGSGPGGQKINKTNSAVQLRHLPTGIVVKYQDTRSREQNRKIARQILAQKVDEMQNGDDARSKVVQREYAKKKASAAKKSRRKYRALEEEKRGVSASDDDADPDKSASAKTVDDGSDTSAAATLAGHNGASVVSKLRAARINAKSNSDPIECGKG